MGPVRALALGIHVPWPVPKGRVRVRGHKRSVDIFRSVDVTVSVAVIRWVVIFVALVPKRHQATAAVGVAEIAVSEIDAPIDDPDDAAIPSLFDGRPPVVDVACDLLDALSFALACFTSCFFALAVAVRFARARWAVLDSLKANAYGMYLIHYGVVVWLQYVLLGIAGPAIPKAAMVFAGAVLVSWSASAALRRVRPIAGILGAARDAPAQLPPAAGLAR